MGRLDLPDVHRDEDDFYGSPVDSPCMAREAGDSIVLRATGEPQYRTIVADPPWAVKAGPAGAPYMLDSDGVQRWDKVSRPSRDLAYPSMTLGEIKALDVASVVAPNAHLYLWTINRYLEDAFDVVRSWGFIYSTTLVWAKNPMGGGLGGAYGISTEYVLFARRGALPAIGRVKGTWFNWKRPYDDRGKPKHSAKPADFFEMVEAVSPGPYLELFARERRPNWHAWGNEVESDVDLAA
jgi:N6-adenosine-specific RNA methylase IME4